MIAGMEPCKAGLGEDESEEHGSESSFMVDGNNSSESEL